MNSYDCILAAVLLTTPADAQDAAPHVELIQPTFLHLALAAEVLDPHEAAFLQGMSKDPAGDYLALRRRFDELWTAPMLAECARFPRRALVEDFLAFNRAYRRDLAAHLNFNPAHADELQPALNAVDQMYILWDTLRDARCEIYYVTVRRQALRQLRDLAGAEAFYRGELPPHVPVSCFPPLR